MRQPHVNIHIHTWMENDRGCLIGLPEALVGRGMKQHAEEGRTQEIQQRQSTSVRWEGGAGRSVSKAAGGGIQ